MKRIFSIILVIVLVVGITLALVVCIGKVYVDNATESGQEVALGCDSDGTLYFESTDQEAFEETGIIWTNTEVLGKCWGEWKISNVSNDP